MSEDSETLFQSVVREHRVTHPEVADAWDLVTRGVDFQQIWPEDLPTLIDQLRRGWDYGSQELSFDPLGDELRVRMHDLEESCPPGAMLAELEALQREFDARSAV